MSDRCAVKVVTIPFEPVQATAFLPYFLEAIFPKASIFKIEFNQIACVVIPRHRISKWTTNSDANRLVAEISSLWNEREFDQDFFLKQFLPGTPSVFPGKPRIGEIGCNISIMQAIQNRRRIGAEKEYLPFASKKDLGQYDTPFWLARRAVENALREKTYRRVIDPMAGEGAYLEAALHSLIVHSIRNLDIDQERFFVNPTLGRKLQSLVEIPKLVGVEVDRARAKLLSRNFKMIQDMHEMPNYDVAVTGDFFEVADTLLSKLKIEDTLIVSNPCWDVIEATNSVRSRSKTKAHRAVNKSSQLIRHRDKLVKDFNSKFGSNLSLKDARNIYTLAILKCLILTNLETSLSFILPKGVLGDRGLTEFRKLLRQKRPGVYVEEFNNKASGSRIFSAVDSRVQFCILTTVANRAGSHGLHVRSHGSEMSASRAFVVFPWNLIVSLGGESEAWVTVRDSSEKSIIKKFVSAPKLSEHSGVELYAGNSSNKGSQAFEGKDIEMFRLRKLSFVSIEKERQACVLVRKILPNGGKKLIAAISPKEVPISDSLLCINTKSQNAAYAYYLSGVLNSSVGEYRLRVYQSNINLNLWKLMEFQIPHFDSNSKLQREIVSCAQSLERGFKENVFSRLDQLVAELFDISSGELETIRDRTRLSMGAA